MDDETYESDLRALRHRLENVTDRLFVAKRMKYRASPEFEGCVRNALDDLNKLDVVLCEMQKEALARIEASKYPIDTKVYAVTKSKHKLLLNGDNLRQACKNSIYKLDHAGLVVEGTHPMTNTAPFGKMIIPFGKI